MDSVYRSDRREYAASDGLWSDDELTLELDKVAAAVEELRELSESLRL